MTSLIFGGRFYIINMVRGRFNEYELPKVIANVANKWKPKRIAIEDSVGVKWMGRELRREMDALKISVPVEFVSLGLGSKLRSKQLKAKPVLRLLGDERMYFLNSCEGLEEIYSELEQFTGTSDDKHDDIVSAISLLVEQFIGYADMDSRINSIQSSYVANAQSKAAHDMMYCLGKYAKFNEAGLIDDNPATQFQTQQASQNVQDPYVDPLADLV
jgi:predicted phage terminase large subunit-like protein